MIDQCPVCQGEVTTTIKYGDVVVHCAAGSVTCVPIAHFVFTPGINWINDRDIFLYLTNYSLNCWFTIKTKTLLIRNRHTTLTTKIIENPSLQGIVSIMKEIEESSMSFQ